MSVIAEALARKRQQLPQFEYLWRVELPDLNLSGAFGDVPETAYGGEAGADFETTTNEISHRVTSVDMPFPSIESAKHNAGSRFVYTAHTRDVGQLSMRIDEMEDGLTLAYLMKWRSLVVRDDGFYNLPAFYKRDIKVFRRTSTHIDSHVSIFHGAYPSEISPVGYSYDGSGIMQYSVTFVGDNVTHIMTPAADLHTKTEEAQSATREGGGGGTPNWGSFG